MQFVISEGDSTTVALNAAQNTAPFPGTLHAGAWERVVALAVEQFGKHAQPGSIPAGMCRPAQRRWPSTAAAEGKQLWVQMALERGGGSWPLSVPPDGSWLLGPQRLRGFLQEQDCYLRAKFPVWVQQHRSRWDAPRPGSAAPGLKSSFVGVLRRRRASNTREKPCHF